MNRPRPRGHWNARGAAIKIDHAHRAKLGLSFKTRTHGTKRQIGKVFPVGAGAKLTLPSRMKGTSAYPGEYPSSKKASSNLAKEEQLKFSRAGFVGFTAVVTLKSGEAKVFPIQAKDYEEFLKKFSDKVKGINPINVSNISIASGGKFGDSVKTLFSKAGHGASGFLKGITTGQSGFSQGQEPVSPTTSLGMRLGAWTRSQVAKTPTRLERVSKKLGQIEAVPERVSKAYESGRHPEQAELEELRKQIRTTKAKSELERLKSGMGYGEQASSEDNRDRIARLLENEQAELTIAHDVGDVEGIRQANTKIQELRVLDRKSIGGSPNAQRYIADRVNALGGKIARQHKVSFKAKGKRVSFIATGGKSSEERKDIWYQSWKRKDVTTRAAMNLPKSIDKTKKKSAGSKIMSGMPSRRS